jgi:hypothetical protein
MQPKTFLIPKLPFSKEIDPQFERDVVAAEQLGITVLKLDFEALLDQGQVEISGPVVAAESPVMYRGWMLSPDDYEVLCQGVEDLELEMLTDPDMYRSAHTFPGWYELFKDFTPRSWKEEEIPEAEYPVIVKDYVKSAKHLWDEACYIPDKSRLEQVTSRFKSERGDQFEGGLVLRAFVPDLTDAEIRTWWWKGKMILETPHPDDKMAYAPEANLPISEVADAVRELEADFVTVDFAERDDGRWIVIEVGDAGVSDFPESLDIFDLYSKLD